MPKTKIELGDEIEDVTSGLRGIAIGRAEYLSGAIHWILQPPLDDGGMPQRDQYIPDAYVKRVGDGVRTPQKPEMGFHARESG
jgi:hypothetical protein